MDSIGIAVQILDTNNLQSSQLATIVSSHNEAKVDIECHRRWARHVDRAVTYLVCDPEIVPAEDDRAMLLHLCSEIEGHLDAIEGARSYLFDGVVTRRAALEAAA